MEVTTSYHIFAMGITSCEPFPSTLSACGWRSHASSQDRSEGQQWGAFPARPHSSACLAPLVLVTPECWVLWVCGWEQETLGPSQPPVTAESCWSQCETPPQKALSPRACFSPAPGFHFFLCKMGAMPPSPSRALDHFQGLFPFQVCVVTASAHDVCAPDVTVCVRWNVG